MQNVYNLLEPNKKVRLGLKIHACGLKIRMNVDETNGFNYSVQAMFEYIGHGVPCAGCIVSTRGLSPTV